MGWLVAGLIVNGAMGASNNGKDYNALQGIWPRRYLPAAIRGLNRADRLR